MLMKAYSYFNESKFEDAKLILIQILNVQHRNIDALQMLAVIHAINKDFAEALDLLTKALKLSPNNPQLLFNRGNLFNELEIGRAHV